MVVLLLLVVVVVLDVFPLLVDCVALVLSCANAGAANGIMPIMLTSATAITSPINLDLMLSFSFDIVDCHTSPPLSRTVEKGDSKPGFNSWASINFATN